MKKIVALILALAMVICMLSACGGNGSEVTEGPTGGNNDATGATEATSGGEEPEADEDLAGITEDTIYVGNTAGTTGALATIGAPFNAGIEAALAEYNANGGYNGRNVVLKHYDDGGDAAQSVTLMEQLIYDDEVFAIVGNFGSYAVASNLDILIDENVPMVYAAAGNDVLFNEAAEGNEKAIFPVQPLNHTEGQMLILRAFAPAASGGLGGTKVGVLSNTDEASSTMLAGIEAEAAASGLNDKIVYQKVTGDDYSAAINAFKDAGCDVVVIAVTGSYFTTSLVAMSNANYYATVLTTYNNASAAVLNDATTGLLADQYIDVLANIPIYAQAWLDITSADYLYNNPDSELLGLYAASGLTTVVEGVDYGMAGFTEEYWGIAESIYSYCISAGMTATEAFVMSYNSFALAGYIAGDLFCQGLEALEASGKALTRANYIEIMESQEYKIAMADYLSFADGMRSGVQSFALTQFYDYYAYGLGYHYASSINVSGLTSMEDFRASLAG